MNSKKSIRIDFHHHKYCVHYKFTFSAPTALKLIITTNVVVYSLLVIIILLIMPQNIVIYTVARLFVLYFDLNTFYQRRHHIALLILFSHRSHFICKLLVKLSVAT